MIRSIRTLWLRRELIALLAWTDIRKRYQGSWFGLAWSFVQPLVMLAVYSFIFGTIFQSRWESPIAQSGGGFALVLFCGIVVFNIFAECVQRAPSLLPSHPYYIKKVIFPTEVLPVGLLGSVLVHFAVSFTALLAWMLVSTGRIGASVLWMPVILLPFILFCLGISWFLAAVGVFIRDTTFIAALVVPVIFFMTPVVYPPSAVPGWMSLWLKCNILSYFIEASRGALLFNASFDLRAWACAFAVSAVVCAAGGSVFMRLKQSFADAL